MNILFPYLAQSHQVLHSLPIAAALSRRPGVSVQVDAVDEAMLDYCRKLVDRHAPDAPIRLGLLPVHPLDRRRARLGLFGRNPWKVLLLLHQRRYFGHFDAVVTPERTSLLLKRLRFGNTKLIWTRHGAGDREVGFSRDVRNFDFVLLAGRKIEQRLLDARLIRSGAYAGGIYAKFDWACLGDKRLFANARPTVLYNPHFRGSLSSWPTWGEQVLETFARSQRYNLIFAPHLRLFHPPTAEHYAAFERWRGHSNLLIDLGSERSTDMSYTGAADLYLGDVSSQVAEFVCRPRPCVFLNAHAVRWRNDPSYRFWNMGPVLEGIEDLDTCIDAAFRSHERYRAAQLQYIDETFGLPDTESSSERAADAILRFLRNQA